MLPGQRLETPLAPLDLLKQFTGQAAVLHQNMTRSPFHAVVIGRMSLAGQAAWSLPRTWFRMSPMSLDIDKVIGEARRGAPLLRSAAAEAGAAVMDIYAGNFAVELKDDQSPLTQADIAAHRIIVNRLAELPAPLGRLPVLSEEGEIPAPSRRAAWKAWWLIDPMDGTKQFVKRSGEFTVNIALIFAGEPAAGWVYAPAADLLYEGIIGSGARLWRNHREGKDNAVTLPRREPRFPPRILLGSSRGTSAGQVILSAFTREFGSGETRSIGSSLKFCLIAEGSAELYPRLGHTMEWDTAAGDAICRASGAHVAAALTGEDLQYGKEDLYNPWFLAARDRRFIDFGVDVLSKSGPKLHR